MPKLTKRTIDGAKLPVTGERTLWDSELRGFGLRLREEGRRSYVLQYRNKAGRSRKLTLGEHGKLTVDQARTEARRLLAAVAVGRDPAEDRRLERTADTLADLAQRYLAEHALPKKRPRSVREDRRLLDRRILPVFGRRLVADLTREDMARLHHSLHMTPTEANRTLSLMSKMLQLAERWGVRPDGSNPCRHVDRYPERRRERLLSGDELRRLGEALEEAERTGSEHPSAICAVRLLLFTGARLSEVLGLRWEYVDLERQGLRLPESKTGAKTIPLSAPALEVLSRLSREEGNPYVLPGIRPGRGFIGLQHVWERLRKHAGVEDVRLHDLRHAFASVGAAAGMGLPIIGALLGHTQPSTTARYAHLAADPLKRAADSIAGALAAALEGRGPAGVVPMRAKAERTKRRRA